MIQNSASATGRDLLTVAEVALELGVSRPTVRRKIHAGGIPAVQLGGPGSVLRVPAAGLDAWLWSGPEGETRAES